MVKSKDFFLNYLTDFFISTSEMAASCVNFTSFDLCLTAKIFISTWLKLLLPTHV